MSPKGFWHRAGRLLCALTATAAGVQAGVDVQVDPDPTNVLQNEVSLTLNPASSGNILMAYNDGIGLLNPPGLGVSVSNDSGGTWSATQLPIPTGLGLVDAFDPITGADTNGTLYAGFVSTANVIGGASGLYLHSSVDGGNTWLGPTQIAFSPAESFPGDPSYRFNDKPHLAVDRWGGSSFTDNVYATWIQDVGTNQPFSDILFAASGPGGTGFGAPVKISDAPSGQGMGNGPNATVAPNGTIYVAWANYDVTSTTQVPGTLMIDKSTDGGVTWSSDVAVQQFLAVPRRFSASGGAPDAIARSFPAIATSPTNSQEVYMVYPADPDGPAGPDEGDIFFIRSTDGGQTWSTPVRVNDDSTTHDQFAPSIAVKHDGTIDIAWYDGRNDPNDAGWDVMIAKSTDAGATFSVNVTITDQTFATPTSFGSPWLGEYLGLAVDSSTAYLGFASSVTDSQGDVYFDSILNSSIPEPATLLLVAAGLLTLRRR